MGYNVQAYAVDLTKLASVVGSGDGALIAAIRDRHAAELESVERIDPSAPSASEALAALIEGRMEDGEVNFKYGYALELVCRQLGTWLSNRNWSAMNGEWFDTVEDAFVELGGKSKICSDVFWSGPPVELPFIDDFPAIGTVTAAQVAALAAELERAIGSARATREVAALRELLEWLRTAERESAGVVTFHY